MCAASYHVAFVIESHATLSQTHPVASHQSDNVWRAEGGVGPGVAWYDKHP